MGTISKEHEFDLRAFIAVAEACHKGSPSWHVLDWMSYKMSIRYPLMCKRDAIINLDNTTC